MILELLAQIGRLRIPTHVFVQGGVGGLAAAVAGSFAEVLGRERPTRSSLSRAQPLFNGKRTGGRPHTYRRRAHNRHGNALVRRSISVASSILRHRADAFISIDDEAACRTVELLKNCDATGEAVPIDAGPSGAARLAGSHHDQPKRSSSSRIS